MNTSTSVLEQAINQHRQGRLEQAEATYRDVLSRHPDDPDALHFLGLLLHQKGDSGSAIKLIRRALRRSPGYLDAYKNLGVIFLERDQSAEAEECYRKAVELDPGDATAWSHRCVALKNQKRFGEAIEAGERAVTLNANDVGAWFNLGNALAKAGRLDQSTKAYGKALELDCSFVPAHVEMCHVLYRMESAGSDPGVAAQDRIRAYQAWLEQDPNNAVARFMLAACQGGAAADRAPDDFVRELFDGFADSFDKNLAALDYRVPGLIEARLAGHAAPQGRDLDVLDAGCGTGLCGPFLRTVAKRLVGVDLSGAMLQKAALRNVYDELIEAELRHFLWTAPRRFDLIVCADTLVYFGALDTVLAAAASALRPGGRLIFSLEGLPHPAPLEFRLNHSGRYAHHPAYAVDSVAAAGLQLVACTEAVLRKESGQPVAGILVEAHKPVP